MKRRIYRDMNQAKRSIPINNGSISFILEESGNGNEFSATLHQYNNENRVDMVLKEIIIIIQCPLLLSFNLCCCRSSFLPVLLLRNIQFTFQNKYISYSCRSALEENCNGRGMGR